MDGKTARAATGIPAGITINGDITAAEDLHIHGHVDGQVSAAAHHVMLSGSGSLKAKVLARTVTVAGSLEGSVTASEHVVILAGARVRGHIHTPSLTLVEGGILNGTVDPERSEAAMLVARYRQKQQA
jgi:cytoskeletal protein CcmA (bactofilin family)